MHTAASLPPRESSAAATDTIGFRCGRKYITAKRRCSGNFFDKKNNCENGGAKLGFLDCGITASPNKSRSSRKISGVLGSPVESLGEKKPNCSSAKKMVNRGSGLRGTRGWSDGEGEDGLGVTKGTPRRRKDYMKKKCNTDANPGKKLLMGNVTILKRGEKIEDVVANRSSDEEEIGSEGPRDKVDSVMNSGREGFLVREEKGVLDQCLSTGKGFPVKKPMPMKKAKVVARVSQVWPVVNFSDMNLRDVETDKGDNGKEDEFLNRLGPEPSVFSKEVGSDILGCVSFGSRVSEISSDDDNVTGEPETTQSSSGADCNVQSASTPLAIPPVKTSDNFSSRTPEPVEYSSRGFLFEKWAGPAYANSPSPTCLPLPKFFIRQKVRSNSPEEVIDIKRSEIPESAIQEKKVQTTLPVERSNANMFSHGGGFDVFATKNLRRLLQLE